ncbi:MAG: PRC-barrel domain containing protein [Alphaproteobacteria bacterium]|nr:MAG: PRC-barrel domain containing protein [Alphaproteobacteria bacterium]
MAGEDLGKIEDLMIDLENGRIAYAVISFGGFLGIGEEQFAIPLVALSVRPAFSVRPNYNIFTLNVNKEILEKAERFDKDKLPLTREQLSNTYVYYGNKPYWETGTSAGIPLFLAASTIIGDKVFNMAGEDIGKIEDLIIDLENSRIAYALIPFGGFLGIGNKQFAIPWEDISERQNGHGFTLKINKEILEKAEGFDEDELPLTREQLSNTYAYYGNKPYWETGVLLSTEKERQEESETESLD